MYLGTWKDEDLTQAILRVVYKDYVPEAMESLVRSVGHIEETTGSWPSGDEGLPDCDIIPVESQIQELEENEEDEEENDEDAVATTHESVGDVKEILRDYRDGKCTAKVEQSETGCHVVQQMGQGHETASVS